MRESKVITFIGGFYIFGGIIALLSLLFNGSQLNLVFNLPNIPDYIVKLLLAIVYIPLGYLYIRRIKYSHWIILILAILTYKTKYSTLYWKLTIFIICYNYYNN